MNLSAAGGIAVVWFIFWSTRILLNTLSQLRSNQPGLSASERPAEVERKLQEWLGIFLWLYHHGWLLGRQPAQDRLAASAGSVEDTGYIILQANETSPSWASGPLKKSKICKM